MKRQFLGRLLSLFLVGTVVAGVGCKDYDDDITSLNNRIDELTTGQIASVEKQMQSLQNAVDRLDGVDSGLKDEIEALQGKAETQAGEIGKLQEELGKAASASEVEALKKQIETLESDKGKLEKRIEALESARTSLQDEIDAVKGSLANYLTKSDAEATYATKTTVESLSQLLNQIKANYVSAEGLASTLEGYVTDAELADYPTLTVLQEAIRQSETAMKNSLGEAMEPILATSRAGSKRSKMPRSNTTSRTPPSRRAWRTASARRSPTTARSIRPLPMRLRMSPVSTRGRCRI